MDPIRGLESGLGMETVYGTEDNTAVMSEKVIKIEKLCKNR